MSGDTVQHLADVLDARPPVDNAELFYYLLNVREQAWDIIQSSLSLREDMACQDIQHIPDLQGAIVGNMHTYTGHKSPVDWIVRSWIGKPETGFTNIHLTCWLRDEIDAPHLGMALGTAPDVFCYVDYLPRYDPAISPEHLEQYHEQMNETWITLRRHPAYKSFNPVHLYTRSTLSPIAVCGLLPFADFQVVVEPVMLAYVRHWVQIVQNAQPLPPEKRAGLKARDELLRRTIVEKDPANILADRMLGVPMRQRLVRILHAAEREQ
ncbi:MAG: hypothetical protein HND44_05405 [Chloroflexi bacterium]|nr:hypothetical protein [Ardenticatenaceae bacterium]MBL1127929.1 hypothetical protein [Chloroflexota bacterium]NOG34000.1 hypothetical protein [Chloroflexota bacterium]GIK55685.1 MAG: hypothetical protein BroJett015_13480 [Chloroflexota bacterium]